MRMDMGPSMENLQMTVLPEEIPQLLEASRSFSTRGWGLMSTTLLFCRHYNVESFDLMLVTIAAVSS